MVDFAAVELTRSALGTYMRKISRTALFCVFFAGLTTTARAQVWSQLSTVQLEIHHYTASDQFIYVKSANGTTIDRAPLQSGRVFEVSRNTEVQILIGDPNLLLYDYKWNGIISSNTPDYDAIVTLAKALSTIGFGKEPTASVSTRVATTAGGKSPSTIITDLQGSLRKLQTMADSIPAVVTTSVDDLSKAKADGLAATSGLELLTSDIQNQYKSIHTLQQQLVSLPSDGSPDDAADRATVALLISYEATAKAALDQLATFRKDVFQIGTPLLLGTVPYAPTQQQSASFEIAPSSTALQKDPKQKDRKVGSYNVVIYPRASVRVSLAPALIYSWAKGLDSNPTGTKVAALLLFSPRSWEQPWGGFGWHIGVGASAKQPAFYFGASLYTASVVHFGAGFAFENVATTGTDWRPGGYVLASVDLAPIKK